MLEFFRNLFRRDDAQVRMGGGVLYFTTVAVVVVCVAIGSVAWALSYAPGYAVIVIALLIFLTLFFLTGTWWFANKNPDQAVLGGSHLYKLRAMQMEAKGKPELEELEPSTDPSLPPPRKLEMLEAPEEE